MDTFTWICLCVSCTAIGLLIGYADSARAIRAEVQPWGPQGAVREVPNQGLLADVLEEAA